MPLAGAFVAILFYETYYRRILNENEETNVLDKYYEGQSKAKNNDDEIGKLDQPIDE
jgi:hypothetical protein